MVVGHVLVWGGRSVTCFSIEEKVRQLYRVAKSAFRRVPGMSPPIAPLFDASWYAKGLDQKDLPADLLHHYLTVGFLSGNPNRMFDTVWYVSQHPELSRGKQNPLVHYLVIGEPSGNPPSPHFDPTWYVEKYPDVAATKVSPLAHFLRFGAAEGRLPKCPEPYRNFAEISEALAALPASLSAASCSIELPVKSLDSLQDVADHVRNLYRVSGGFCEGLDGPPEFPENAYVARIDHSLAIGGTRYLVDCSGAILHDENANFFKWEDVAIKYEKAKRSKLGSLLRVEVGLRQGAWVESGLNIMHEYENNYFHFIAETFPRIVLAEESALPVEIPYLITGGLHPNIKKLCDLVRDADRAVINLERGTLYRVEEMYYPSDLTSMIDAYNGGRAAQQSGLDIGRIRIGVDRCLGFFPSEAGAKKRRIFASRSGTYRKLLNQDQIEERIVELGFEVVDTNNMDLESQIRLFRDAEIIAGPTGAQISNMVWCQPGAKVLVLASDHPSHQLYFWALLGQVSNAAVTVLQGPRSHLRKHVYSLHDDYSVDENAVIEAVSRLI